MLKPRETINGTLLLFSVSATAKHYATCQLIHSSHLIDRYIVTWFYKTCFHESSFVSDCAAIASRTACAVTEQQYTGLFLHSDDKHICDVCRFMCLLCVPQYLGCKLCFFHFSAWKHHKLSMSVHCTLL
jgi:hypothetical protein